MQPDTLPVLELIAPSLFVLGAIWMLGPVLPMARPWARLAVFITVWLIVARYIDWRIFTTVLPAEGPWYKVGWIWFCLAIELLAFADQFILYLAFLRSSDRRAEADSHEMKFRALPTEALPSVDVFIPTYDEPIEVLEKTIIGALCLDYPNFKVWVLDDGRRAWLKEFCEAKGAGYFTRPDNTHAKAGNINHALSQTNGEFFAIFDADFVPQRNFLLRTIGFFSDPRIGIVQTPHAFYNNDPIQTNLGLCKTLPDEQRLFFDAIMPCRDGWDAAFCCGSNSLTRRAALHAVGDALPTQSITEDVLLTLVLLRKGYITRYLREPLALGLAPESLDAFFVQRQRWARGAIQILYLGTGPLGRNLSLMQRLLFLPTYWLSLGSRTLVIILAPIVFLWTGVTPVVNVTTAAVLYYLVPMALAICRGIWTFAPREYVPLAGQVSATIQSFKILPSVLATLVNPFGHVFRVTPKGSAAASGAASDLGGFCLSAVLMVLTMAGLIVNVIPEWRIIGDPAEFPLVALWAVINIIVLFLACMVSLQAPIRRAEERFEINEQSWLAGASGTPTTGRIRDISISGAAIVADTDGASAMRLGESLRVFIGEVGWLDATLIQKTGRILRVSFRLPPSVERDLLIRKLFIGGRRNATAASSAFSATGAMLKSIWSMRVRLPNAASMTSGGPAPSPAERLPAKSLIIQPQPLTADLAELAARRTAILTTSSGAAAEEA